MADAGYDKLLNRISKASGLEKEEIERKIEAKRAKLSGLISKEGAAQVVSAELGINFDDEKLKIDELVPGMRKANFVGKIINLFPVRTFERQGKENKVANFVVADDTSNIKVVLWDTNHISLIEEGKVKEGSVVEINSGSVRDNEVHLGSFSGLKVSDKSFDDGELKKERVVKEKSIKDFNLNDNASVRAFIVQAFDPRFFNVCPECRKKVTSDEAGEGFKCEEHGKVPAEKRALINIVLDDGTESIRSVIFHDQLQGVGITELENQERLSNQKQDLLGKEMVFSGVVRMNRFFNNPEFIVNGVQDVNVDELIAKLEA
jgi:ssDNA-binding replication factor A large subunit